ncbi:MAG TPA: hypothetical protein VGR02_06360 [Thermoanaerobaculia bacterium]|jgi:hypothetical protein|nr:hypothetical protein [Thermoanaerobaculia bacterium]
MKKLQLLLLAAVFVALPVYAAKKKSTIKVTNQSKWEIHHLFVSSTGQDHWGPDQLGEETIGTGESFTLTNIDCDDYDIKVIDEDGDECVIEDVNLCGDTAVWKITDKSLLKCEQESD